MPLRRYCMGKFKTGLAADLKVHTTDIDVVVKDTAARRHLLAGGDDYLFTHRSLKLGSFYLIIRDKTTVST